MPIPVIVVIVTAALFLVLDLALGFVFFFMAFGSKRREDVTVPCKGSLFERNKDNPVLIAGYKWYDKTYHQHVTTKSRSGVTLHAAEFRNPANSNVWAITVHGWTNVHRELSSYAMEYYRRGFNVLMPDLRGHGDSESRYVSMGWLDRLDLVDWANSIAEENPNARIILHGVSMGAATVMMATGERLPENVVFAVADCGYTSVKDIMADQAKRKYHLPVPLAIPAASFVCKLMNGFFFGAASSLKQLEKSKTPTLFIHGGKDDFVLIENLATVYGACTAPKERFVLEDAEHAVSNIWFHDLYWDRVDEFMEKHLVAQPQPLPQ